MDIRLCWHHDTLWFM